jgi:rubrerythrin
MGIDMKSLSAVDALDLAILIEDEARERYEEFSKIVGGRYAGDASDMFRMMARYEGAHKAELLRRRESLYGNAPCRMKREMLDDVEAPSRTEPRTFMSAHQAMQVALRSEEKAYEFFVAALAQVTDHDVRTLFDELRREELHHQELVKQALTKLPPGADLEEDEADAPGSDPG